MPVIPYTNEDIKNAKINLANQNLTSFQSAILLQHIENLQQRIKELENINDKLSSALTSAEQRIDKVIDLIINHHNDLIIISDDGRRVEICFKKIISNFTR